MKPWEIINSSPNESPDDKLLLNSWKRFKQQDFYFALHTDQKSQHTIVYLCPKEYFDTTGWMFEDSIPIVHLLPDYLEEVLEAIYETSHPKDRVLRDLCSRRFVWGSKFQDFVHSKMGVKGWME